MYEHPLQRPISDERLASEPERETPWYLSLSGMVLITIFYAAMIVIAGFTAWQLGIDFVHELRSMSLSELRSSF